MEILSKFSVVGERMLQTVCDEDCPPPSGASRCRSASCSSTCPEKQRRVLWAPSPLQPSEPVLIFR